ncbi:pyridoxal kinase PdxY [Pseudoroseomonas cervicalis]|uniref:pyridoxal kinase n=1 Tax=Pseudoroseomonas cervicalis ATCC 49957 TaxID=525371 RepID=D5RJ30_9PROT|nr:pyridoxal kinase PdxY [Pseudoroseomonas cervicalis]EFH12677.1 pyridoxal kinase [Pseudoroseomonas cervicalis ATCC 49957]
MNILSIQSWVAYGHVGNASAVFPLQRLGAEVWAVNTVQFSNHTGYGSWRGQVFGAELVRDLVQGIEDRGALPRCDAVLSGYMGDAAIGEAILDTVARVKAANPAALYCCDPVIGDVGRGVFVRPGIPEFMRDRALPAADILTPNQFELEWLTGQPVTTLAEAKAAVAALQAKGPRCVLVTSLKVAETPEDQIEMLAAEGGGFSRIRTPMLPLSVNGAGDAIAALFLFHRLTSGSAQAALGAAASSVYGLLRRTSEAASREILTVAAQEEFVAPSRVFLPEAC